MVMSVPLESLTYAYSELRSLNYRASASISGCRNRSKCVSKIATWTVRGCPRPGSLVASAEPGTIAICFVAAALQSVRGRDLNADELLANVGLSSSLLQVPQARVSAKHYGALWRTVALALDDEFFGQDSRRMKAGSFAMLCHSVLSCKTLGQALDRSLRFYRADSR